MNHARRREEDSFCFLFDLEVKGLSLLSLLVTTKLELLAALDRFELAGTALGALHAKNDLLGSLSFLVENRFAEMRKERQKTREGTDIEH